MDSEYGAAHLRSWPPATYKEWYRAQLRSFVEDGVSLDRNSLYSLPARGCKYMTSHKGRASQLLIQPGRLRAVSQEEFKAPPISPPEDMVRGGNNPAPSSSSKAKDKDDKAPVTAQPKIGSISAGYFISLCC